MQISTLHENGIRPLNEDHYVADIDSLVFGVFDGASPLSKWSSNDGKTGGYLASHIVGNTFLHAPVETSLARIALIANNRIVEAYHEHRITPADNTERFSTSAAVFSVMPEKIELLQIGDSVIIVEYRDGRCEAPLGYLDQDLETMRQWRALTDAGRPDVREQLNKQIREVRNRANIDYGNLNGDPAAATFLQTAQLDRAHVKTILAITDGLFIPKQDPDADEQWAEYIALFHRGGLRSLFDHVRKLEKSDPELTRYPRFKIHDDATAVAAEFV